MSNTIVTIARQYGSGGREIGEKVASLLGYNKYDRELITMSAEKGNMDPSVLKKADGKATNNFLYTLSMGSNIHGMSNTFGYTAPINDRLFALQCNIIQEVAKKEDCVVIGRCGDYVLRDYDGVIRFFIYAPLEEKKIRVASRHPEIKADDIVSTINKMDKRRSSYYNFYTGSKWGKIENYDYMINSSILGIDGTAQLIADIVRRKNNSTDEK